MPFDAADDYPVHQLPVPLSQAMGERNFYDRYWFNGYSSDGKKFFAAGLAVYPHLGIADAAFSMICGDTQYNLRASRHLQGDRTSNQVGPIRVEILQPLHKLRLHIDDPERGFEVDLVFTGRFDPIEEPRHQYRVGNRIVLDSTRLTQLGNWTGQVKVKGESWQPVDTPGTRDRSWGVRNVGSPDSQQQPNAPEPQFYWLWAPVHLRNTGAIFFRNDYGDGLPWNRGGHLQSASGDTRLADEAFAVTYQPHSRRVRTCAATAVDAQGRQVRLDLEAGRLFYMTGIGYMHPEWGHGMDRGPLAVHEDSYDLTEPDQHLPPWLHVQAFSSVRLSVDGEVVDEGIGVLEQLLLGPHAPSGFKGLLDPAL